MLGNRGFPEAWSCLRICQASFLMTFAMGGGPHAGARQSFIYITELTSQHSYVAVVQWLSHVRLLATPWTAAHQASLSITNSQSLLKLITIESAMPSAGSQREELRPWQRSWGRRLGIMQRWDRASGSPLFPSIYPPNQSLPTLLFHALTYTSDFMGGWPPLPLSEKELSYSSKSIKIPGRNKSVSTYKLLWRFSSLPEQVHPATCDCLQPPNHERHEMF